MNTDGLIPFDAAEFLTDEESRQAYLNEVLSENSEEALMDALATIARSRGIAAVAEESGLSREHLYRLFRERGNPRLGTFLKLAHALGFRLEMKPLAADGQL